MEITGIASGIYESMWQMAFGIVYYCAMLVITFGIKVIITLNYLRNNLKLYELFLF